MRRGLGGNWRRWGGPIVAAAGLLGPGAPARGQEVPGDATWTADAAVAVERAATDPGLGATQGVVARDGKVYAYGDVREPAPRVGVIREYGPDLAPTGRVVWLRQGGKPLILHPTGLTWDDRWGTFLGDTVAGRAVIYRLDWGRAWRDGDLTHAVLAAIPDDAAVNGCRPVFVALGGRTLLATADYGDVRPELRLLDPESLLAAGRTSAPGVVVHRVLSGPFNQNLHWDAPAGRLVCIQNVVAGRGWRLDSVDLARAVADGRVDGPGVRASRLTFPDHDELEGYWPLGPDRSIFAIARRRDNLFIAAVRAIPPRPSPPAEGGSDTAATPAPRKATAP